MAVRPVHRGLLAGIVIASVVLNGPVVGGQAITVTPTCTSGYYLQAEAIDATDSISYGELSPDEQAVFVRILNRSTGGRRLGLLVDVEPNATRAWAGRIIEHEGTTWEIVGKHVDCLAATARPSPTELPVPVTVVSLTASPATPPPSASPPDPALAADGTVSSPAGSPGQPGFGWIPALIAIVLAMCVVRIRD